jgi:hypothetical protein
LRPADGVQHQAMRAMHCLPGPVTGDRQGYMIFDRDPPSSDPPASGESAEPLVRPIDSDPGAEGSPAGETAAPDPDAPSASVGVGAPEADASAADAPVAPEREASGREAPGRTARPDSHNMLPPRERRRSGIERLFVRLIATAGIVGVGVAIAAIMVSSKSQGWVVGLVVSIVSVVLAAILWSSRQL